MAEVITPEMLAPNASPKIKEFGLSLEEFYKLKYCSTVVYMVPRA